MAATIPAPMEAPALSLPDARRNWRRRRCATHYGLCRRVWRAAAATPGSSPPARSCATASAIELAALAKAATEAGRRLQATGTFNGTPRSVAFNVQAFRIAVNKRTGAIKLLRSVHAADAGRVINPMQCRGQVEGGVAQSLGATLYEEMLIDDDRPGHQSDASAIITFPRSPTCRGPK